MQYEPSDTHFSEDGGYASKRIPSPACMRAHGVGIGEGWEGWCFGDGGVLLGGQYSLADGLVSAADGDGVEMGRSMQRRRSRGRRARGGTGGQFLVQARRRLGSNVPLAENRVLCAAGIPVVLVPCLYNPSIRLPCIPCSAVVTVLLKQVGPGTVGVFCGAVEERIGEGVRVYVDEATYTSPRGRKPSALEDLEAGASGSSFFPSLPLSLSVLYQQKRSLSVMCGQSSNIAAHVCPHERGLFSARFFPAVRSLRFVDLSRRLPSHSLLYYQNSEVPISLRSLRRRSAGYSLTGFHAGQAMIGGF
ncbi:hypothetical protein C8R45DRAFT_197978 [Mycena sanguinolenta]|nr:hypothetical protein C8R45DRAFT_197978 [Mycena sanguinolenta]